MQETVVITITGTSKDAVAAAERASAAITGVSTAAKQSSNAAQTAGKKLAAAGGAMSAAGQKINRNVGLPILAVGAITGKMAVDFEKAMRNVNSIAGLPERQFRRLNQSVLDLAGPTAQAPKTLAEGLYDLVSSGFNASESMQILKASAKAATAGLTTTEVSTQAVAAVLNSYHLPASKAAEVSDILFQTVNRGVINFSELSSQLGYIVSTAASSGMSLRELGAEISTLTLQGQVNGQAITNLNQAITAFNKPSKEMKAAVKELGYESAEALLKQEGFQGAVEKLGKAAGGSSEKLSGYFGNVRAGRAAFALTGKGAEMAQENLAAFGDVSGATARVFREQSKSMAFQLERLKSKSSVLAIEMGNKLLPVFRDVADDLMGMVQAFGDLSPGVQGAIIKFAAFGLALGPVLRVGGAVTTVLGGMTKAIGTLAATNLAGDLAAALTMKGERIAAMQMVGGDIATKLAGGLRIGLPLAIGAVGVGNILSSVISGDMEGAGYKAGGAVAGAIAGGIAGSLIPGLGTALGAVAGGGIGSFLGDFLGDLFDSEKELTPMQRRLQSTAKMVAGAMKAQKEATQGVAAAQDRLNQANGRHRRSTDAVKDAQQRYRNAIKRFGPDSLPALQAALRLARAQRQEKAAADEARRAHKAHGITLELYEQRTTRAVAADNRRIPVLRQTVRGLTRKWRGEKDNVQLSQRLEQKVKELNTVEGHRSRTIERAAQVSSPKFARSLQRMGQGVSKFVTEAGKIRGTIAALPRNIQTPIQKTEAMFNGNTGLIKAIRAFKGETKTQLQVQASNHMRRFSQQGAGSFRSLAEQAYLADENIGTNTTGMLEAFGAAKIPKFSLQILRGGKQGPGFATGGFITTGTRADTVPAMLGRDEAVLNVHQQPEVQTALAFGKAAGVTRSGSLGELFTRVTRPNYLAKGGKADGGEVGGAVNLPKPQLAGGSEILKQAGDSAVGQVYQAAVKYIRKHMLPKRVLDMYEFAKREAGKGYPYVYGGGHGSFSGPYDCSGYVSAILHAGKFLSTPMSTQQGSGLNTLGEGGPGKFFTWGVRGTSGMNAHTMMNVMGPDRKLHYFESGSGHGAAEVGGWAGAFEFRHMPGFARGGEVSRPPEMIRMDPNAPQGAKRAVAKYGAAATDPRSPHFVGWGYGRGGFGREATRYLAKGGWTKVGYTTYSGDGGGSSGELQKGHGYAELGSATSGGALSEPGHLAAALGRGTLQHGFPLEVKVGSVGKVGTLFKYDRGYGDGNPYYAIDIHTGAFGDVGLTGHNKGDAFVRPAEGGADGGAGLSEGEKKKAEAKRRKANRENRLKELRKAVASAKTLPGKRAALWKMTEFWGRVGLFDKDERQHVLDRVRTAAASVNPLGAIPILSNLAEYMREHGEVSGRELGDKDLSDEIERARKKGTKVGEKRRKRKLRKIEGKGLADKRRQMLAGLEGQIGVLDEQVDLRTREASSESSPAGSEFSDEETGKVVGLNNSLLGKLESRRGLLVATIAQVRQRIAAVTEEIKAARPAKSKTHWKLPALIANREEARRLINDDLSVALDETQGLTGEGGRIADVKFAIQELGAKPATTDTGSDDDQRAELLADLERQRIRGQDVTAANLATFVGMMKEIRGTLPYVGAFAVGGVVPGPMGRPALATVHGGERVVRADVAGQPVIINLSADLAGVVRAEAPGMVRLADREIGRRSRQIRIAPGA